MASGYAKQIQQRIEGAPDGMLFINSDFLDIADTETVRRNLNRLVKAGTLRRIINGIYEKPKYSELVGEYVAADPDAVAKALARCYHWTIAPCGNTALNMLGLSTQVTAVWSYISDDVQFSVLRSNLMSDVSGVPETPSASRNAVSTESLIHAEFEPTFLTFTVFVISAPGSTLISPSRGVAPPFAFEAEISCNSIFTLPVVITLVAF